MEKRILVTIGYICQQTKIRLSQERTGWFRSKSEREQKGFRKSKTYKVGAGTASHPQLVKDKNEKAPGPKRLIRIQPYGKKQIKSMAVT